MAFQMTFTLDCLFLRGYPLLAATPPRPLLTRRKRRNQLRASTGAARFFFTLTQRVSPGTRISLTVLNHQQSCETGNEAHETTVRNPLLRSCPNTG